MAQVLIDVGTFVSLSIARFLAEKPQRVAKDERKASKALMESLRRDRTDKASLQS